MRNKLFKALAVMAIIPVMLFAGCEKKDNSGDQSLTKVLDNGKLILGLDPEFPPMGFKDKDNNIVGFDIDLATEVCKRLDIELVATPIDWSTKETELNVGNIDCIWNGMSIDSEREKLMNLSMGYMKNEMVLVVKTDSGYTDLKSLEGKQVAVQNGSTAQTTLADSDFAKTVKETIALPDNATAFIELENETVDAVFVDSVVANYYIASENKDFTVLDEGISEEIYAIGFRKDDKALTAKVEETLKAMKEDGTVKEISEKWFGKDVTIF